MKHATKAEASAARLAALQASREKRTYAKHVRWAEEMRGAGWRVTEPSKEQALLLRDADGDYWQRDQEDMYICGSLVMSRHQIERDHGPVVEVG